MKNFDDLLARRDAAQHFFAERLFFDPSDELLGDLEIHIGFQQREADLAQRVIDVGFADRAMTAEVLKDVLKLVAELRKHGLGPRITYGAAILSGQHAGLGAWPEIRSRKVRDRGARLPAREGACAPQNTVTSLFLLCWRGSRGSARGRSGRTCGGCCRRRA